MYKPAANAQHLLKEMLCSYKEVIMNIGFIGLGIMGLPMAVNLMKGSKQQVLGYDISLKQMDSFVAKGGAMAESPKELAKKCDLIFICLPTNEIMEETANLVGKQAKPDTILVDLGSTSPILTRQLYGKLLESKIHLLDSPVSGGEEGAINGELVIMCGGEQDIYNKVQPYLSHMGSATYMGDSGCGSIAKLANNIIVGCNLAALGEAFAFATKAGLNPQVLFDAIKDGFAGSKAMDSKVPKLISGDYSPAARIQVHKKDLDNARELAKQLGVEIPMSNMVLSYMNQLVDQGKGNKDHCAVAKIYEKNMNVKISEIKR